MSNLQGALGRGGVQRHGLVVGGCVGVWRFAAAKSTVKPAWISLAAFLFVKISQRQRVARPPMMSRF